jgi:glutaminase
MTTHSLIGEGKMTVEQRLNISVKACRASPAASWADEGSYSSELATAYRNFSIAYMLRNYGGSKPSQGTP